MISFVVAMDNNRVIGYKNKMPWHLPNDLKFFKEKTTGHTIIMGRKTFESIGRILPNRRHVVLTRGELTVPEEVIIINSLETVKEWNEANPEKEYFVIGGGHIYEQFLPYADRLYITKIDESFEGDTYFPEFPASEWELVSKVKGTKDSKNPYDYYFLQYDRKS